MKMSPAQFSALAGPARAAAPSRAGGIAAERAAQPWCWLASWIDNAHERCRPGASLVSELRRDKFGARSEKLDPEQFNLPLEDVEVAEGVLAAAQDKARAALQGKQADPDRPATRNRGHLPAHLPRVERVIEPASKLCPCGCGVMAKIGEDVSERLDVIPA